MKGSTATDSRSRRRRRAVIILAVLLVLGAAASVAIGSLSTSLTEVFAALRRSDAARVDVVSVVWDQRIPRTIVAAVVGACLGVAGALIQGHTRNPLADPGILGVSSAAALAVVLATFLFRVSSPSAYIVAGIIGAGLGLVLVLFVARLAGGAGTHLSLVLSGAALTAFFGTVTTTVVLIDKASLEQLRLWSVGSVAGRDLSLVWWMLPLAAGAIAIAVSLASQLNALTMGEDTARGLGINVGRQRTIGLILVTVLAGSATAVAGPIGFVGLMVPHLIRALSGADYRWIIPLSALAGSVLLIIADVIGRVLLRPAELQVGIVMALVGAPIFIYFVRRGKVVQL